MIERRVALLSVLIEQHRVTLRKCTALAVLPREANPVAVLQQRAKCERLAGCPINALAALDRFCAGVEKSLDCPVDGEALRDRGYFLANVKQHRCIDAGITAARILGVTRRFQARPASIQPVSLVRPV